MTDVLTDLEYLNGPPEVTATFKQQPEHFQVIEQLELTDEQVADNAGEHQWLWVYKRGANTPFVARKLAEFAGVGERQVSYSGMKDRQAETWQWFSVQLPGQPLLDWQALEHPEFRVENALLQTRKLKTGTHKANQFRIVLTDVSDVAQLQQRWQQILSSGVPNYFGAQRFGHDGQNYIKALAWLTGEMSNKQAKKMGRNTQSMLLSAARSWVFNHITSARIAAKRLTPEVGDVLQLSGSQSIFVATEQDNDLAERWQNGDVQLTAPLVGDGENKATGAIAEFEAANCAPFQALIAGLQRKRVQQARRRLLLQLTSPNLEVLASDSVALSFALPSGCFATAVLRELVKLNED